MTEQEASLLLRCWAGLCGEGIGPDDPQPGDDDLIREAIGLAGEAMPGYYRHWFSQLGVT